MCEFMYSRLAEIHVHVSHSKALLVVGIVIVSWSFVSLPAALLIGRVMRLLGCRGELPAEIVEAPPEMPVRGRVA